MTIARSEVGAEAAPYPVVEPSPAVPVAAPLPFPTGPFPVDQPERARLAALHETMASLQASRGRWRDAYEHLRSALDLTVGVTAPPPVPEQLRREVARLRREHAEAREQSLRDSLTDSYNRRYLDQRLGDLSGDPRGLAVALVDLDFFKLVNDTHGHLLGDRVLQRVVEVLCNGLPDDAFCARYGGEEFVLVLPDVGPVDAVAICEAARDRVERHAWQALVTGLRVTVSIGVTQQASAPADGEAQSVHEMLNRADELLYAAKQSGRNAVAYRHAGRVTLAGAAGDRRSAARS